MLLVSWGDSKFEARHIHPINWGGSDGAGHLIYLPRDIHKEIHRFWTGHETAINNLHK
jgi:hypothetical protein